MLRIIVSRDFILEEFIWKALKNIFCRFSLKVQCSRLFLLNSRTTDNSLIMVSSVCVNFKKKNGCKNVGYCFNFLFYSFVVFYCKVSICFLGLDFKKIFVEKDVVTFIYDKYGCGFICIVLKNSGFCFIYPRICHIEDTGEKS